MDNLCNVSSIVQYINLDLRFFFKYKSNVYVFKWYLNYPYIVLCTKREKEKKRRRKENHEKGHERKKLS